MASPSSFSGGPLRGCLALLAALVSLRCSFSTDNTTMFQQQPVPPLQLTVNVQQSAGASTPRAPQFALAYQLYFASPASQVVAPISPVSSFPQTIRTTLGEILPASELNRGFALGYGNYVLGAAYLIIYDDLNGNGVFDDGEPIVGSSAQDLVVYFQGTTTQEVLDQFGALKQGYNLCVKTSTIRGVDLFQVSYSRSYIPDVTIPKAEAAVTVPKLH